jgi:DNA-binding IclR family transcriptional regulator
MGSDAAPAPGTPPVGSRRDRGIVQSLDRALSILDVIGFAHTELSLGDVAARVGLAKSTAHRLLRTLELRGFVARNPLTGGYRPGMKNSGGLGPGPEIHEVLERLAARSGETANLGALVGAQVLYVDRAESSQALRWQLGVGARVPVHCSGLGKAILSCSAREVVERLVSSALEPRTDRTITDRDALFAELAISRLRGYALDNEEFMEGVRCIAVPVRGATGEVGGAISIAGPAFRLTIGEAEAQATPLKEAAQRVSRLLGYEGEATGGHPR